MTKTSATKAIYVPSQDTVNMWAEWAKRAQVDQWLNSHVSHAHVHGLQTVAACIECDHTAAIAYA